MKKSIARDRRIVWFAAAIAATAPFARAAGDLYWDSDGTTGGGSSGATATGTWGTSNFWNSDSAGGAGTFTTTTSSANDVHFAASTDVTGAYTVSINGAQAANKILFEEGAVTLSSGTSLTLGGGTAPGITVSTANGNTTISTAVLVAASQSFSNNSPGLLSLAGVTATSGAVTLTLDGSGAGGTTFGGVLGDGGGTISLTVNSTGGGTTSLNAVNTYTGPTTVSGGILAVGAAGRLGDNNTSVSGGILRLAAASNVNTGAGRTVTVSSTATALGVLGLGFNADPSTANASFVAGANSSDGVLAIDTTAFTAVSTNAIGPNGTGFLGSTLAGTYANASLTVGSGNTYRLGGGGGTLTVTNAVVTGNASLVVGSSFTNGGGTVILSAANDYTGTTTVANGVLSVIDTAATGTGTLALGTATTSGTLRYAGSANQAFSRAITVGAGGYGLDVTNSAATLTVSSQLAAAPFAKGGAGKLILSNAANAYSTISVTGGILDTNNNNLSPSAGITLGGGTSAPTLAVGSGTLTLASIVTFDATNNPAGGTISANSLTLGAATRTFTIGDSTNAADDLTITAPITGTSAAGLTKTGAGTLTLAGTTNTYPGTTTLNSGTLKLNTSVGLAVPGTLTIANNVSNVSSSAMIVAGSTGSSVNQIADTATVSISTGSGVVGSAFLNLNDRNETIGALSITANTTGQALGVQTGSGTLTLGGTLTFATSATSAPSASSSVAITGTTGGKLALGSASRTITTGLGGSSSLANTPGYLISDQITSGGIVKAGGGPLSITSGLNDYAGGTVIQAGIIRTAPAQSGTTVITAGSGTGVLGTGNVTVNAVASGSAPLLELDNNNSIADSATLQIDSGVVNGRVFLNFSGNETVNMLVLGGVAQEAGTYNSTTTPAFFNSGSGNLVVLVPEPGSLGLAAVASLGLLKRRRRR